jgi:signal peptide peptidase SppA
MKLIDLVQEEAWAIRPEVLDTIHAVLAAKLHSASVDLAEIEARTGKKLDNTRDAELDIRDGVAVIPVRGVLAKRMNLMTAISGGTSMEMLKKDIQAALDDDTVEAVILDVDSPGGTVAGTMELATWLYARRGTKPIKAFANEQMASAAYWIGSAADSISAQATAQIGSIGVITAHYDYSQYDARNGVKRTFLTAGKYKAMGNDAEPLSQEARDYIQEHLDQVYTLFVDDVARNRGVSAKQVISNMADGKVFLAAQAMETGLIDNLTTGLDELVRATREEMRMSMTIEKLRAEHPDIVAQLNAEWTSENSEKDLEARTGEIQAARAETQGHILELHAAVFGQEISEQFEALVKAGTTVEQLTAMNGILGTKKTERRSELLAALQAGDTGAVDDAQKLKRNADQQESFMDKVRAYKAEHGCDNATALRACARAWPELHSRYIKDTNSQQGEEG